MARRSREDGPGAWHHVINRGIAKRALFETRADARFFLARLARQVRCGRIEVHAYCLMTTHFHLLLRSPIGELSEVMRRVQNDYSRRFNRRRRRDGTLVRGRFFSRPVHSLEYRRAVVRYIDVNPVRARVARSVGEYPLCSAAHFLSGRLPRWLSSEWIRWEAQEPRVDRGSSAANYMAAFHPSGATSVEEVGEFIDARMRCDAPGDELHDLIAAAPREVREWMQRKARLADGTRVGAPVCGSVALRRALAEDLESAGPWAIEEGDTTRRVSELALLGMLHDLCGSSWQTLARTEDLTIAVVRRRGLEHRRLLDTDTAYAGRAGRIAHAALSRSLGIPRRRAE
ncbi:MAG: transposase [Planctomycetes bacterium]|nr:transposase [Planctomycetota bacterium]